MISFGCSSSPKTQDFYGEWKYIKVENPNQNPPNTTSEEELSANDPSITFTSKGDIVMMWGGKQLSHGTFKIEYPTISYQESMADGKIRSIRFLIKKFDQDILVFETMEADAVRVTARKVTAK
ncbi:hypothetical protein ADIARSV_4238 [Arcticibacter svalbardensis MN12-7]|uniref:Lipocalin-like domain-containing protein n=1 Tax=Arcticibacter svalbardensis MN12-7 TaxID=1150600 RepID=R9GM15_9SPHI|nr:hypothetical protein ADIARSV_4238 [Arcticibacter svalbardensis MN12-7]